MLGKCKICGEQAEYEKFGKLCKRHYLQMLRHGKILSVNRIVKRVPENSMCSLDYAKPSQKIGVENGRD